jgi:hypothetical protein
MKPPETIAAEIVTHWQNEWGTSATYRLEAMIAKAIADERTSSLLVEALKVMLEPHSEKCHLDHNDICRDHWGFGGMCYVARAREALAKLRGEK